MVGPLPILISLPFVSNFGLFLHPDLLHLDQINSRNNPQKTPTASAWPCPSHESERTQRQRQAGSDFLASDSRFPSFVMLFAGWKDDPMKSHPAT
jgi:hypothetical protein